MPMSERTLREWGDGELYRRATWPDRHPTTARPHHRRDAEQCATELARRFPDGYDVEPTSDGIGFPRKRKES